MNESCRKNATAMTVLLDQVKELRQQVDQLAALFTTLQNPLFDHIIARTHDLDVAITALPTDANALRWWLWHTQAHHLRNLLTPIQGYARLLQIQPAQIGYESYTDAEDAQFSRVNALCNAINEALTVLVEEMRTLYRVNAEMPPQALPLHIALAPVWPIVRYTLHDSAIILVQQIDPDTPSVLYHPLHTTALLQHLVATMGREWMAFGTLVIDNQREQDTMALRLVARGLRISDVQWEGLFKTAADQVYYKRLAAMGGTLERLTSQGTHEEGMAVHLPLAGADTLQTSNDENSSPKNDLEG